MKSAIPKTELRRAVLGGSLLLHKSVFGALAVCSAAMPPCSPITTGSNQVAMSPTLRTRSRS